MSMTPAVQRVTDEADKRARDKAAMPAGCQTIHGEAEDWSRAAAALIRERRKPPNAKLSGLVRQLECRVGPRGDRRGKA